MRPVNKLFEWYHSTTREEVNSSQRKARNAAELFLKVVLTKAVFLSNRWAVKACEG